MSIKTEQQEILFMADKIRLVTLLIIIVKVKPNKAKVSYLLCTVIPQPNV